MFRYALACALVLGVMTNAAAQPTLAAAPFAVPPGTAANLTVSGPAGQQFAIIASSTNSGMSYAGVQLQVGTDVSIVAMGTIGGGGTAVVPVTPPFPARDRFYYQAVLTTNGFAAITPTPGTVLVNAQDARSFLAVGGGVNAAGAGFALSPGVTTQRTAAGTYSVQWGNQFNTNVIPTITPFCGLAPSSVAANNGGFTVTFAADCGFFFTGQPIRR